MGMNLYPFIPGGDGQVKVYPHSSTFPIHPTCPVYITITHSFLSHLFLLQPQAPPPPHTHTQGGRGGLAKRYYWIFLLFKSIRILTRSVKWGAGFKNYQYWHYIIYGWRLQETSIQLGRLIPNEYPMNNFSMGTFVRKGPRSFQNSESGTYYKPQATSCIFIILQLKHILVAF